MMNPLYVALLFAFALCVMCEGTDKLKQANQPAYQSVRQPAYQSVRQPHYRQYEGGSYDYNNAYRSYDAGQAGYAYYPQSYDTGSPYLHLSGGVYRPYEYDYSYGAGYRPYAYDNTYNNYYDGSSSRYVAHPQAQYGVSY